MNELHASEFTVDHGRRVFLNGVEIKDVLGFSINAEVTDDPEVIIRVGVSKITIDGYTDYYREHKRQYVKQKEGQI